MAGLNDTIALQKKPFYKNGTYLFFCCAFFTMSFGTSAFTLSGALGLCFCIISILFQHNRFEIWKSKLIFPVLAVIILTWAGLLWSTDVHGSGIKFAGKTYYWLFALALASIPFNRYNVHTLFRFFFAGLALNALTGLLQLAGIVPVFSKWGLTGFSGSYNSLAMLLNLGMLLASVYAKKAENKKEKAIYIVLVVLYFSHLIILQGRGGYLTFAVLSPIILYHLFSIKRIWTLAILYLLVIGLMFSSPVVQKRVNELYKNIVTHFQEAEKFSNGEKYSTYVDRIYMWNWALSLFGRHPFLGVGTGGYSKAILNSGGDRAIAHPHNNILYIAVSYGILGLVVFGWLFWVLLKIAWIHPQHVFGNFILFSVLVIFVGGLVDTPLLDAGGIFLFSLTVGLGLALELYDKPTAQSRANNA
ncbi:MAG: O-antigen ligase family protein [Desulfobacteraceae bacterium]|nr:MAG: O-antigen ligase family protein [Desulfobacteraceae bacterium]